MKAMLLQALGDLAQCTNPLAAAELDTPIPGQRQILVRVHACGVCHTELDEIEGRTPPPQLPVIPGHQVVGTVVKRGANAGRFRNGDRVGVAWIHSACGACAQCRAGDENLCADFRATGRDVNGGYAEFMTVNEDFAYPIPSSLTDVQAAPLLCGGAIGFRSLRLTGLQDGQRLGLTGFGASAHLVLKMAQYRFPRSAIYVFARSESERNFARELGAVWAGESGERPPEKLHAIIDTTPAWKPVMAALEFLEPGGRLVINAIRKEDRDKEELLRMDYPAHLWQEKEIKSVANVSRRDVRDFLALAAGAGIHPDVEEYPLTEANRALLELKRGGTRGAKVLVV